MLYISDNAHLIARHVAKFHGVTPPNPKVIGANTLNYKPIFDPPLKKLLREPPSSVGCRLARLGTFYSTCKKFGVQHPLAAEIWYSEKFDFQGTIAPLNLRD